MKILFCGEAWQKTISDNKGCDFTIAGYYKESVDWIKNAPKKYKIEFHYLPAVIAQKNFPDSLYELQKYDTVFLSDIGSNTCCFTLIR